ncbi:MAG: hypothetical protein ACJ8GN_01480 [Longimicrobiaceae bacterium]
MAEKPAGPSGGRGASSTGGGSKIPRDAFVSRLVPDPANLEDAAPRVLRGYVGDSDEPGYSRIYCGQGLEVYADVRDEDILHYEAATDGGEHTLWAKADAQVKYGRRGAAKGEASGFVEGPLLSDYGAGGGGAGGGGPIGVTGWLGCGQPTHLIGCTGWLGCHRTSICPGTIHLTTPTQIGCITQLGCAPPTHQLGGCPYSSACLPRTSTCPPTYMPGCPDTSTCAPAGGHPEALAAAAPLGPTGWQNCTQLLGCPNTSTCTPQTHLIGCPNTSTCTPQTHLIGCPRTSTCPPTYMPGCPDTSTCAPEAAAGAVHQSTAATLCTRYGCQPPHGSTAATVCTHYGCPSTAATLCTRYGCPGPATYQYGCTLGFTCTYVGCP